MAAYTRRNNYPRPQDRSYSNTRSPLAKAATMGFAYVKQNSYGGSNSQPQNPAKKSYVVDGFSSLPRPKRNAQQPQGRENVNSRLQMYFKSLNFMSRSILLETETVEKEHHEWKIMDNAEKEEVVNDHFIPQDIRLHYSFDFPLDRSVSHCSAPPSWPGRPHSSHSMNDAYYTESTLHLSQPNEWDYSRTSDSGHHHSMIPSDHSLSLSQPSLSYNYENREAQPTFNRLHKQQLSFRPRKMHAVKKPASTASLQPSRLTAPRRSLGSDGESPRTTSDEDYEIRNRHHQNVESNLGFQRTKLRSYSMRARKGASNTRTASTRGSMRAQRRKPTTPESNRKSHLTDQSSRPSHFHSYSMTSTDTDYDAEIDLPEPSLMIDISDKLSESRLNRRNSRNRRSFKAPKLVLNKPSPPSTLTRHAVPPPLDSSADDLDIDESILDEPISIHRAGSHDSLDTMTPSTMSKSYLDDDAESTCPSEASRMTPDSILSVGSYRPKTKQAEMAVLRNRRGKWGGSSYRHVTSNFADRHTQFKPNMLRSGGSAATSASTTRAPSPADSIDQQDSDLLKPPRFAKYNSATESITSDLPHSPDRLSHLISPPATPSPLTNSAKYLFSEKRESGYISSSSESFQIGSRRI